MGIESIETSLRTIRYQEFVRSQIKLLKFSTENVIGTTPADYLKTAEDISAYIRIDELDKHPERVVFVGDIMTILPENPTPEEIKLAKTLTSETDFALKRLKAKDRILGHDGIPITTIMVRSHEEVAKIMPAKVRLSGVISRTVPPFFNIFNLQASKFASEVYGEEMGEKISLFSHIHEDGHLVFIQDRAEKLKRSLTNSNINIQIAGLTIVSTVLDSYGGDEIFWELWANRLPNENPSVYVDGNPIFPYWTAKQGENRKFIGKKIFEKGGFDHFSSPFTSHYPEPNLGLDYPFVMDPADAQEYLEVTKYLLKNRNSKFYWL